MYKVLKSQKSSFDTVIFSPANCLTCTGNLQTAKCRSLNPYMFIIANHVFESARKRESMRITNGLPTMGTKYIERFKALLADEEEVGDKYFHSNQKNIFSIST